MTLARLPRLFVLGLAAALVLGTTALPTRPLYAAVDSSGSQQYYKEALKELDQGNYSAARIQLRNSLQRNPDNLDARLLLGKLYVTIGDPVSAEKELRRVIEKRPTDEAEALLGEALLLQSKYTEVINSVSPEATTTKFKLQKLKVLAAAHVGKREIKQGMAYYRKMLELDPESIEGLYGIARIQVIEDNLVSANQAIEKLIRNYPDFAPGWMLKGEVAMQTEDRHLALYAFNKAVDLQPGDINGYVSRGRAYLLNNEVEKAQADAERVLNLQPNSPIGIYLMASIAFTKEDFRKADQHYVQVQDLLRNFPPAILLGALIKFRTEEFAQSESLLTRYLNLNPGNRAAKRALGIVRLRIDRPDSAIDVLKELVDSDPNDLASMQALASAYLRVGAYKKADAIYQIMKERPDPASTELAISSQLLLCENSDMGPAAEKDCNTVLKDDLGKSVLLVLDYVKTGDLEVATTKALKLAAAHPDNEVVLDLLGSVYMARGEFDAARKVLDDAIELNPGFAAALQNLEQLDNTEGTPGNIPARLDKLMIKVPGNATLVLRKANYYADRDKIDQSIAVINQNIERFPDNLPLREALIHLYIRNGDTKAANAPIEELVDINPSDVKILEFAQKSFEDIGNLDRATEMAKLLTSAEPGNVNHAVNLARLYYTQENYDAAETVLLDARQRFPGDVNIAGSLGDLFLATNQTDKAIAASKALTATNPNAGIRMEAQVYVKTGQNEKAILLLENRLTADPNPAIALDLFRIRRASGQHDDAIEGMKVWLTGNPRDRAGTTALAGALVELADYRNAEKLYKALLVNDPANAVLLNNMAWVRGKLNRPDALDYAERAYELSPDTSLIADTYGWLLVSRDKLKEGLDVLERATRTDIPNPDILYHYAFALNKSGNKDKAREILNKILADGKTFDQRGDAENLLNEI